MEDAAHADRCMQLRADAAQPQDRGRARKRALRSECCRAARPAQCRAPVVVAQPGSRCRDRKLALRALARKRLQALAASCGLSAAIPEASANARRGGGPRRAEGEARPGCSELSFPSSDAPGPPHLASKRWLRVTCGVHVSRWARQASARRSTTQHAALLHRPEHQAEEAARSKQPRAMPTDAAPRRAGRAQAPGEAAGRGEPGRRRAQDP
jgi:hypothetical protein